MCVREWLEQIKKLDELINAKIAERDRYTAMATSITAKMPDGMPFSNRGTASDKVGDGVVKLIMLECELNALIDEYVDLKKKIVDQIEKLPPKEYGVIHRRYVLGMTMEAIADEMGKSTVQVWRIRKKALRMLQNLLDGGDE